VRDYWGWATRWPSSAVADDVRDDRRGTHSWHLVDIRLSADRYDASRDGYTTAKSDCDVAELERLQAAQGVFHIDLARAAVKGKLR